jgi:ketosteroid isomerase-like protein
MPSLKRALRNARELKDVQGVLATIDRLTEGLRTRNFDMVSSAFSQSGETIFAGSEKGKTSRGGEAIRGVLRSVCAASHAYSFSWDEMAVTIHGDFARVYAEGTEHVRGSHHADNPYRLSAFLVRVPLQGQRDGEWLVVHYHGAEPVTAVEQAELAS